MKSEINFRPWPQMPLTERVYLMFIFFLVAFFPFIYIMGLGPSLPKTPEIYTVTIPPTPTPTPANHNPNILQSLPDGRIGQKYLAKVKAVDRDGDSLFMEIKNLPAGLKPGACLVSAGKIACEITGTPQASGSSRVKTEVADGHGGKDSQIFELEVLR